MTTTQSKQLRATYGEALVELGAANSRVVVVDADMAEGTMTGGFKERFPERFFDVGVAEQNLMGVGAGLSLSGWIPFVNTFAWLLVLRAGDPLRTLVSYARTNVKVVAGYGGFSGPMDGATHQAIMDLAVVRALPNMTVVVASDHHQVRSLLPLVADLDGPVYLRLSRAEVVDLHEQSTRYKIGKATPLRSGGEVTLISNGPILGRTLTAADLLAQKGIPASVLEVHTLKPLDGEAILAEAARTRAVVTVEEHNIIGGLGSAVAELLSENLPLPLRRIGIRDRYGETGAYERLLDLYGMAVRDIVTAAEELVHRSVP
ncbi:MAG: transketolase family protein [Spirochaetaceae bacterium]|nr:MAG: transketolase family protein [Spirochaetaceae bacterium]